jgi:polysaccharide biosynthesis protein PslH
VKVLFLCHRIPYPPNKGEKIRAFYHLRAMGERHEVDLLTLADDPADLAYGQALEQCCHSVQVFPLHPALSRLRALPFLLTRRPLTLPYYHSPDFAYAVEKAIRKKSYDRIFVYCSAMAQYAEKYDSIPVITDLVDVDSNKWDQYAGYARVPFSAIYRREGRTLREYERKVCELSSAVLVTTEREAQLTREICGLANVHVVSIGVDTEYFKPAQPPPPPPTVVFTGDMGYFPNAEAVRYFAVEVLPLVRKSLVNVRFLIVGRNPGRNVRKLQNLQGVEVTGFVPDVRPYLAQAHVAVAPFTIAAGIQNKVIEALAYGLPVVATTRAAQGLVPEVASTVAMGGNKEELADHVLRLLRDPDIARRTGAEGRRQVSEHYSWPRSLDRMLELLDNPGKPQHQ